MLLAPTSQRFYGKLPRRDDPQTQKLISGTELKAALSEQECERAAPIALRGGGEMEKIPENDVFKQFFVEKIKW